MRLRPKITILLLFLSILPLTTIGTIAYYSAVTSLRENLGSYFRFIARQSVETIEAKVFEISQSVRQWASLELMQDAATGDLDGRIVSFLTRLSKEKDIFNTVDVLNPAGEVIASNSSFLMGKNLSQEKFFQNASVGVSYIGDVELDPLIQQWGMNFAFPIWAEYGLQKELIGIVRAHWKAGELSDVLTIFLGGEIPFSRQILLARKDGLVMAGTEGMEGVLFRENMIHDHFEALSLVQKKLEGYFIEKSKADKKEYLIGYSFFRGHQDLGGSGWSVLVIQECREVFASIYRMAFLMFGTGGLAVAAGIFILFKVSRRITAPVLDIARTAEKVAAGDWTQKVGYTSGDELGTLAQAFNKMVDDLRSRQARFLHEKTYMDSIISSMADALFVVDIGGIIRLVNQRAADLSGYPPEELKGESLRRLFGAEVEELVLRRSAGEKIIRISEGVLTAKDGREVPVEFSSSAMFDSQHQIHGIVCLVRDAVGEGEMERSVHQAEIRKAAVVDAALDCVVSMDHNGKITEFNHAAEEVFGYKRTEVIGQYVSETIIPAALRERHREGLKRYLATGEGPFLNRRVETTALRCDGTEFPVELSIIRIPGGGPPLFTAYLRDITQRKKTEMEIKRIMAMKDEFVSTVSHELRTPLAISKEGLSLLLRGKAGTFTDQQKEILQMSASNIDRLAFLIDDILDISKIEAGKMTLSEEFLDVVELARENCRGWDLRVKTKNLSLILEAPRTPIILAVDKMRFMQILSNLINNAFKFTPHGGRITVRVEELQDGVRFSVCDTGVGITVEDLPKIFDKFYQGRRSIGSGAQGTGLGLSIVRSLVELHGGRLEALSEPGKGSVFSFTIPRLRKDKAEGGEVNHG